MLPSFLGMYESNLVMLDWENVVLLLQPRTIFFVKKSFWLPSQSFGLKLEKIKEGKQNNNLFARNNTSNVFVFSMPSAIWWLFFVHNLIPTKTDLIAMQIWVKLNKNKNMINRRFWKKYWKESQRIPTTKKRRMFLISNTICTLCFYIIFNKFSWKVRNITIFNFQENIEK